MQTQIEPMGRKIRRRRKVTGVVLDEPVIEYLDRLSEEQERNRSYFINRIVREHAERNGTHIPSAEIKDEDGDGEEAA